MAELQTADIGKSRMTKAELERFRTNLETKQAELTGSLRNRDEIVIEKAPDPLDEVQQAGEREFAIRSLDRDSATLCQIQRALARVTDGTYGICPNCEEEIAPKRIRAILWVVLCIGCQQKADRHEIEVNTEELFESAA